MNVRKSARKEARLAISLVSAMQYTEKRQRKTGRNDSGTIYLFTTAYPKRLILPTKDFTRYDIDIKTEGVQDEGQTNA